MKRTLTAVKACLLLLLTTLTIQTNAQSIVAKGYTFTETTQAYSYLSGGTPIHAVEVDDGFDILSLPFSFRFCGNVYNAVTVCSNGWLRFGSGPGYVSLYLNENDDINKGQFPCVYPLYEDLTGIPGTSSYVVTGTTPNRIFKWECRSFGWDYKATQGCISYQVWLHETTGVIEFHYKHEPAAVQVNLSGGATIGIASSTTDYHNLTAINPAVASTTSYYFAITSRPSDNQVYIWDPGPPCPQPVTPTLNSVNSTSADLSWTAATGAQGYEYFIDQNSTPPTTGTPTSTTNTTVNLTGLTPATTYYLHVRTKCGTYNYSAWVTYQFNTLPPCAIAPPGITVSRIDSNSADLIWPAVITATSYEYFVKTDDTYPTSGTGAMTATSSSLNLTQLNAGTTYYIFLRVKCTGNDSSSWLLDSFYVPYPCRPPSVQFSNLNSNQVVAYWDRPVTSVQYEILNSTTAQTPVTGIKMTNTSYYFPFLDPGTTYYVYARSYCEDRGVAGVSDWAEFSYKTWPLGVNEANEQKMMHLYPNPAGDELWMLLSDGISGNVTVIDISGTVLIKKNITDKSMKLDIHTLSPGIYTVQVFDGVQLNYARFTKL